MGGPAALPTGTVTFLFTDIEGSTRLARKLGEHYDVLLDAHRAIVRAAMSANDGVEVACPGDGFVIAFAHAADAIDAAVSAQRDLLSHAWPEDAAIRVRMGLHSGTARVTTTGGTYVGLTLHEAARVMSAAHGGQILVSDATAGLIDDGGRGALVDLGLHHLRDLDRPHRLFQVSGDGLDASFPDLRDAEPLRRMPQARALVGREDSAARVADAIASSRLVTLVGPGGVGKTSLALAAVDSSAWGDDAWFVDLAAMAPAAEEPAVAEAFGMAMGIDTAGDVDALTTALRSRRCVVILDNCEHVIDAAAAVAGEVLERCAGVKLLATSRESLGVRGETLVDVEPLPADDAAELFRARAADLASDVSRDPEGVRRICAALDGLPLAIELAARRTRTLSPSAIADRLDDRFRLLATRERGSVARHATLEATVTWSHDLLDDAQRVLFRRLAVFAGGWTLDAAEVVCGLQPLAPDDVLDLLAALVDRSLFVARGDRFAMLETLRAFAVDRLADAGETAAVADAHLRWSAQVADRAFEDSFFGTTDASEGRAIATLAAETGNLRSAVMWAIEGGGDADLGLAAASAFGWLGQEFGAGHADARGWIDALLPRARDPLRRASALLAAANALGPREMQGYAARSIAVATQCDGGETLVALGRALNAIGLTNLTRGSRALELDRVREELAAVSAEMRAHGLATMEAITIAFESTAALQVGEDEVGLALAEDGVALARRSGSSIALARCLEHVARALARLGDPSGALDAANEAVAVARSANLVAEEAFARARLSRLAAKRGDLQECRSELDMTIALFERGGMWAALTLARAGAAATAVLMGDADLAREHARELMTAIRLVGDSTMAPTLMAQPARAARSTSNDALALELEALVKSG
jgi:predicted ATPase/class 3 adenylate cyclase